jgi:hypothetical protein
MRVVAGGGFAPEGAPVLLARHGALDGVKVPHISLSRTQFHYMKLSRTNGSEKILSGENSFLNVRVNQ